MAASGFFGKHENEQQKAMEAAAAAMEMKMMADAMGRMMETCFKKCVADFAEVSLPCIHTLMLPSLSSLLCC